MKDHTSTRRRKRRKKPHSEWYTTGEVAKKLGVSTQSIIKMCGAGLIDFQTISVRGDRRIHEDEIGRLDGTYVEPEREVF
jgi:hypothetical protein